MLDGDWINHIFASSDEEFNHKLDEAFKALDVATATKEDYCRKVAEVLCGEVSRLCLVLKEVCEGSGYGDYFDSHISHERFVRLVLSIDTVKLGKMKKIIDDVAFTPIDILRNIGAVLNDESPEERAALGARARRIADTEIKCLVAETKNAIDEVGEKVDALAARTRRAKCRGKYTSAQIEFCARVWDSAYGMQEIRNSSNTKVSYEAVFCFYRRQLAKLGIESVDQFKSVVRAAQARARRALEANCGKSAPTERGRNGIIHA